MSQGVRLLLVSGLSLVVGAAAGAYATRTLYGEPGPTRVDPSPSPTRECPPCPECPVCRPPPDCEEVSLIPADPDPDPDLPTAPPRPPEPALPGLSAAAIQQALAAVRVAVEPCLTPEAAQGASGMLLVNLTVATTGTTGVVREALVTQRTGDPGAVEACVERAALDARFAYEGPEGAQQVRLPLRLGERY